MDHYRVQLISGIIFVVIGGLTALLVWGLHRQWWRYRGVRKAAWMVPAVGVGISLLWSFARALDVVAIERVIGFLATLLFVMLVALFLTLPFTGVALTVERIVRWAYRRKRSPYSATDLPLTRTSDNHSSAASTPSDPLPSAPAPMVVPMADDNVEIADEEGESRLIVPGRRSPITDGAPAIILPRHHDVPQDLVVDQGRRSVLAMGAVALPALAVGSGAWGVVGSERRAVFPEVTLTYPNLHPDLEGLRIMHLTDLHLGYYIRLDDLEEILIDAEKIAPDILLVTGDLSDDIDVYLDALKMIGQIPTRYGSLASLGNHDYYRGIRDVLAAFEKGPLPLLVDQGTTLKVKGTEIYVGAANDPVAEGGGTTGDHWDFLNRSVERAFDGSPSDRFRIFMTHRPEGFDPSAAKGIELTLAGHTHAGGQMGWNGRSLIETWFGIGKYMWGHYEKNDGATQLYTAAGAGHWLPFRLGVPREVPVYTLRSMGRG